MKVAPLWRRFLAGLINVGVLLPIPLVGGAVALMLALFWPESDSEDDSDESEFQERFNRFMERQKSVFWVMGVISAIAGRNNRSVGAAVMRLRRVDARTGGPVTVRSALIRHAVSQTWAAAGRRWIQFRLTYGEQTNRSCWSAVAATHLPKLVTVVLPTHQSIPDRLAGIITVVED